MVSVRVERVGTAEDVRIVGNGWSSVPRWIIAVSEEELLGGFLIVGFLAEDANGQDGQHQEALQSRRQQDYTTKMRKSASDCRRSSINGSCKESDGNSYLPRACT